MTPLFAAAARYAAMGRLFEVAGTALAVLGVLIVVASIPLSYYLAARKRARKKREAERGLDELEVVEDDPPRPRRRGRDAD